MASFWESLIPTGLAALGTGLGALIPGVGPVTGALGGALGAAAGKSMLSQDQAPRQIGVLAPSRLAGTERRDRYQSKVGQWL